MSSSFGAAFLKPPLSSSPSSPSPSQAPPHPHDDNDDDRILSLSSQDARTSISSTWTTGNEHGVPFDSMSSGSARSARSVDRARRQQRQQQQQQQEGEQDHDHEPAVAADSTNAQITREESSRAHLPPTIVAGSRPPPSSTTSPSATSPPPASSSSSAPSTSTRSRSTATNGPLRGIADMRTKTCWVCYEDSSDTPGREFVHACDCTLVAHTDVSSLASLPHTKTYTLTLARTPFPQCLLAWVTTDQLNKSTPAKCPVCATPYVIVQDRSTLLALYKRLRRRWHSLSIVLAGSGLVAGFGFVSAAWGAWAIKTFAGNQVARALLLRHEWLPWRYWLKLPLIPLTLILARTPLIDSLLPFLPLTIVLSNHSSSSSLHSSQDPLGLNNLSLTYPPSPTLLLCALPWIRLVYLRLRRKVFKAVLGRHGQDLQGFAGMLMDLQEEVDEINAPQGAEALPHHPDHRRRALGAARFQVVAEVQLEQIVQPEPGPEPAGGVVVPPPGAGGGGGGGGGGGAAIIQNRLRLGFGRLTSLMVGALLFPAICSTAGSGLSWLASKGGTQPKSSWLRSLRHLLGVHTLLSSRYGPLSTLTRRTSWFSTILFPSFNSTFTTTTPSTSSPLLDPIWLRNAYGGGIVLLMRDVVELMMGWFELKRDQSRRIVGRPFGKGLEFDQVEVEVEAAARGVQSAAGRDRGTGREARVHNLL